MSTADAFPPVPCDVCGEDVPHIALTLSFQNPSVVGHRACVETNPCGVCHQPVVDGAQWQEWVGKVWAGHKECAQAEAAKYVLVHRDDLALILCDIDRQHGDSYQPLFDALGEPPEDVLARARGNEPPRPVPGCSPQEFAEKMRQCHTPDPTFDMGDPMTDHLAGDQLMAETLRTLGYGEGVDLWESLEKWYR